MNHGRRLTNSCKSPSVTTPNTNFLDGSVTIAKSCFPMPAEMGAACPSPGMTAGSPLKNRSSSSSGVSMVITRYTFDRLRLNRCIAVFTGSDSRTLFSRSKVLRRGMLRYPIRARVLEEITVRWL